jgi:hypothetical protein
METVGACFERCLGQAPAEVLMLQLLEAATAQIVAQSSLLQCFDDRVTAGSPVRMGSNPNVKVRVSRLDL